MSKDKKTALPSSSKKLLKALGKPRDGKDNPDISQAFEQLNQLEKAYKKCSQQKKKLAFQLKDIFLLKQELNTFVDLLDQKRISPPTVEYIKKTLVELSSTLPELVEDSDAAISFNKIMSMVHALTISEQEASKIYGTILIYDTNPNSTELLKRRLSQDGHHVMVAKSYPLFENYINIQQDKGDLDLVIVDQANIKLSDIIKKLGSHDGDFFTPLILTGSEQKNQTLTELFSEGITDYLVKPFNHILLKKRVESALEKKYAFDVRQRRKKEVLKLKEKFKSALSHIQEGFVLFNPSQKLVMHNDQLLKIYTHWQECTNLEGVSLSDFLYTNTKTIESITDVSKKYLLKTEDCIELTELSSSQWYEITKNHSLLRVNSHKTEDGNIILTVRDLVETIAQEQELNFMAHHDSLTGLANRKAFNEILVKK